MNRVKAYLSIIIFIVSSMIGYTIIEQDIIDTEYISYLEDKSYITPMPQIKTLPVTTTTTSTTTTKTTTTVKKTNKKTTTAQVINKTFNTMEVENYDKKWVIKKGTPSYSDITNGNKYAVLDNRLTFDDKKMIIYGHSYKNGGGLFNFFQNYDGNPNFYKNHKYITINYENEVYKYEIFSVYVVGFNKDVTFVDEELEYFFGYKYTYNNWIQTLIKYKNNSEYPIDMYFRGTDKILIIQTCSTNEKYTSKYDRANLLIFARLVNR